MSHFTKDSMLNHVFNRLFSLVMLNDRHQKTGDVNITGLGLIESMLVLGFNINIDFYGAVGFLFAFGRCILK